MVDYLIGDVKCQLICLKARVVLQRPLTIHFSLINYLLFDPTLANTGMMDFTGLFVQKCIIIGHRTTRSI